MSGKLPFHSVFIVLGVGAISWIIVLGGFSAITAKCNDRDGYKARDCGQSYSVEWFAIWLQFAVLLMLAGFVFLKSFAKLKPAIMAFASISTVLFIYHAEFFSNQTYFTQYKRVLKNLDELDAYKAAAAGAIIAAMFNFALIVYVSLLDDPSAVHEHTIRTTQVDLEAAGPAQAKTVATNPAPTTVTAANV